MSKYLNFFKLAGYPGYLLLGYDIVQLVLARSNDGGGVDAVALIFAAYSILCLVYSFVEYFRKQVLFNHILFKTPLVFFILYTLFGMISCMWSDNLPLTLFRAMECLALLMLVVCVYIKLIRYKQVDVIYKWTMLYVVFDSFCKSLQAFWTGGFNAFIPGNGFWSICQFVAPLFFFLFFLHSDNKYFKYFILLGAIFAKSTVGYIAIVGSAFALFLGDKKSKRWGLVIFTLAIICNLALGFDGFMKATISSEHDVTNIEDSSGRNEIWEIGVWAYEQSPIYGHGFFYYENYITKLMKGSYAIGMHNSYLSALVGEGIIGLVLFSLFMIMMLVYSLSNNIPRKYKAATLALMLSIIVETIGNPSIGFRVYGSWIPSMVGVVLIVIMAKYGNVLSCHFPKSKIPKI